MRAAGRVLGTCPSPPLLLLLLLMHSDRAWSVCRRLEEKRVETVPGSPTYIDYWLEGACPTFQNNETWCCCSMDTKVAGTAGVFNNLFCTPVSGCASDAHEQTAKCIPNVEASLPQADESIPMEVIFGVGGGVLFLVLVIFAGVIWFVRKDMVDILNAIRGKHKKDGTHGKMSITPSASNSASSSSRGAGGGGSRVGFSSRDGNSSKGLLGQDDGWGVGGGRGAGDGGGDGDGFGFEPLSRTMGRTAAGKTADKYRDDG